MGAGPWSVIDRSALERTHQHDNTTQVQICEKWLLKEATWRPETHRTMKRNDCTTQRRSLCMCRRRAAYEKSHQSEQFFSKKMQKFVLCCVQKHREYVFNTTQNTTFFVKSCQKLSAKKKHADNFDNILQKTRLAIFDLLSSCLLPRVL